MALHPILLIDHVVSEYRDYLRTEFRAKDPALRTALEEALDRPLFLAQEPFFQAHRPFRNGRKWRELPIDPKLARVMENRAREHGSPTPEYAFLHQSEAIDELLSPGARPVVVTTGTGSGKTEAFLLPVIQNAIEDAVRFKKSGLTAILVYPMNALANDQILRIREYLKDAGFSGSVTVDQYDRGTTQSKRESLRANPPHILLTNYMMLEYLLVRPADREAIFANHRCRFLVLDEVHTYRGTMGSNIALLIRRLRMHLKKARQDWMVNAPGEAHAKRYPELVPVGTSATIKTLTDDGGSREEALLRRDEAVQEFFAKLTGAPPLAIRVFGEVIDAIRIPDEAAYAPRPISPDYGDLSDPEPLRHALCELAGAPPNTALEAAARRCLLLWDLNRLLVRAPMSASEIAERLRREVPERKDTDEEGMRREVAAGLVIGAALPDGIPGALRLRTHRFIRGGWRFYRCLNPACGRLFPMGEERCLCGFPTAPLFLCRNCGADYLRFVGEPDGGVIRPSAVLSDGPEWMLFEPERFEPLAADDDMDEQEGEAPNGRSARRPGRPAPTRIKNRPVLHGSLDPATLLFSANESDYALKVTLSPARTQCLCCGGTSGSHNVLTPVSLGTSAALKVMSEGLLEALEEANRDRADRDGKERLLIFSDSRQDAAHQARFIIFASRYDRMRRAVFSLLAREGDLPLQRVVELLGEAGVRDRDNPYIPKETEWIPDETLQRIRSWEEAPLLDDLSVTAGYRSTLLNLGIVGVVYHRLDEYARMRGERLAGQLGIAPEALEYICRAILDEMRVRGALSREMLRYHPAYPACPAYIGTAQWERHVKQPRGYAATGNGEPVVSIDAAEVPPGITSRNAWRRPGAGGRGPSLERILHHLLAGFGGAEPDEDVMLGLLHFLHRGNFIVSSDLFGYRERRALLQVNAETLRLRRLAEADRRRCGTCGMALSLAPLGYPCPKCRGIVVPWPDQEIKQNRNVQRILADRIVPLVAREHTAQVPNDDRLEIETDFKGPAADSRVNLLACSPTLEMGIDVGGLDAVALRNIPPRPDNYAQRGGRAGRRSRVGLVLGYARSTPHDQYFYDRPTEMIAGEVPAPALALGNRDVLLRHLNAIIFGAAEPGLAGRMIEYIQTTGEVRQEAVDALIQGLREQFEKGLAMAADAFGREVLDEAGLDEVQLRDYLSHLPGRVQDVFDRTSRQIIELRQALENYARDLLGKQAGTRAADLVARLLGVQTTGQRSGSEADDRSAGYPLRRFAEFGILPGYEFPSEPASLRLLGDPSEEDPVTVARRFGIAQFQPDASVYARTRRWKVRGLDTASPWNPRSDGPSWTYRVCPGCGLRFHADEPRCPRCRDDSPGQPLPAVEFGGFLAWKDESPVVDEEERYAERNLVRIYPQWDGDVIGRWRIGGGWSLRLSKNEEVHWLNEGLPPTDRDFEEGRPRLHAEAKGYLLCGTCGRMLSIPEAAQPAAGRGRRQARTGRGTADPFGHKEGCPQAGTQPRPLAIAASGHTEVMRLIVPVPAAAERGDVASWGLSLGYALRIGIRHLYMLDGAEIDFELEGPWTTGEGPAKLGFVALSFIDPSLGGTGYLRRAAEDFHYIARRALEHLDHENCETACYRCLKSYANQRFHELLNWTMAVPSLEALAGAAPEQRPPGLGDIDDPGPWLEAYAAGVGSPLELKFLRLFERHGFKPARQVPLSARDGAPPISVADFAVPERRLAIYIDGASYHAGANLRRDRHIRDRLRDGAPPWRVVELRAKDLAEGRELVERLMI